VEWQSELSGSQVAVGLLAVPRASDRCSGRVAMTLKGSQGRSGRRQSGQLTCSVVRSPMLQPEPAVASGIGWTARPLVVPQRPGVVARWPAHSAECGGCWAALLHAIV
jgi:hypothetical protein